MLVLIESGRRSAQPRVWTARALSLAVHAGLITAAVMATRQAAGNVEPPVIALPIPPWPSAPGREPSPCHPCQLPGRPIPTTLPVPFPVPDPVIPPVITTGIVPGVPADSGPIRVTVISTGLVPPTGAPQAAQDLDEPPVMLSHPEPRYPDVLRLAGIEGRVVIEAVLDTAGRAEQGSLRVVWASHPLFAAEAQQVVLDSRFRPGRMGTRAVRVRVQVPIAFSIRR